MTNSQGSQTPTADPARSLAAELAAELDKKRLHPGVIAAGLGNALTLLRETIMDLERRSRAFETHRLAMKDIYSAQGTRLVEQSKRIAELEADVVNLQRQLSIKL